MLNELEKMRKAKMVDLIMGCSHLSQMLKLIALRMCSTCLIKTLKEE
jgi:hypothetical protein